MTRYGQLRSGVTAMALAILASSFCRAQTPPSAPSVDPFAPYDAAADSALDRVLRDVQQAPRSSEFIAAPESVTPAVIPALQIEDSNADAISAYAGRFWSGRTEDLREALWRLTKIRPVLEKILDEEGVPSQFAAVVLVESGANPVALSPKSARGLWQFMPETAQRYGLVVSEQQDDRTDLFKSTRAAARYLRDLYRTFGEWRLALAAYDAGEGAMREAIQRARSFDFQLLSDQRVIPAETRNYVPAVLEAVNLLAAR